LVDWEGLLKEASQRVQKLLDSPLPNRNDQRRVVGIGASGDKTLAIDRRAEAAAIEVILQARDTRVVSEERGEVGRRNSRWTVLLDPIDGSANFERGIPFFCTSLAVAEGGRLRGTKHGLVRNLVTGDVYYAEEGCGSEKNGRRITTSPVDELKDSVAAIDLSSSSRSAIERLAPLMASVKRNLHLGANALELCLLAEGEFDLFVDLRGRMRVTDLAGGRIVAKEAGGTLTTGTGRELDAALNLGERLKVLASANERLHAKSLAVLRSS
jgi:myo-inositol-1(or 4)-monophosphatase